MAKHYFIHMKGTVDVIDINIYVQNSVWNINLVTICKTICYLLNKLL